MAERDACALGPVVIIGAGLIGASAGQALTRAGVRVQVRDLIPSHAVVASLRGAGIIDDLEPDDVDLVIVAVPPRALGPVIMQALDQYPHAVVTDVGSVKTRVWHAVRQHAGAARYVGSHPMAGSHLSGPITADPDLFVDRTWAITPVPGNSPESVERVRALARLCAAIIVELDPESHDTAVAQVSHLPQVMASLTAGHLTQVPGDHLRLAGQGVRDVTRIAGSDAALWQQILVSNADAVRDELAQVHQRLGELLDSLNHPDEVEEFLERGRSGRRALPGKHGLAAGEYEQVVIEIPDTPGALARLFAEIDAAGVNVEDLAIEHDPVRQVGFLAVAVAPERASGVRDTMQNAGWTVRA